ncbi:MAG: hypothetical protein HC881_10080 [Leptolyngbyaceae cyanobacterium SL_7_1]|nr:hypothetical protein [Leptolyngbyaceae cyanobacterium SL_7_1]
MTRDKNINARPDGSIHARPATPDEVAYRDGYAQGRTKEQAAQSAYRRVEYENQRLREDNSAANGAVNGVVIGLVLASLVGAIAGAFYFLSQNPTVAPVPEAPQAQPAAPQPPVVERQTTVIERTVDRVREVQPPTVPEVEVTIPAPELPAVEPVQPETVQPEAVQPQAPEAPTAPEEPAQ